MMELPPYHLPTLRGVLLRAWDRVRLFVKEAGQVIVLMVIALNVLNSLGTDGSFGNQDSEHSVLSETARVVTPLFAPMGLREDNWPAVVGVFSGILAKEVVVGTLDNLYTNIAQAGREPQDDPPFDLVASLREAATTVPANLSGLRCAVDPLGLGSVDDHATTSHGVNEAVFEPCARFDGQVGAFAYLLFVLLYFPCVATIGVIRRETGTAWAAFVAAWTTGVATHGDCLLPGGHLQRTSAQLTGLDPGVVTGVCGDRVRAASLGAARWPPGRSTGLGGTVIPHAYPRLSGATPGGESGRDCTSGGIATRRGQEHAAHTATQAGWCTLSATGRVRLALSAMRPGIGRALRPRCGAGAGGRCRPVRVDRARSPDCRPRHQCEATRSVRFPGPAGGGRGCPAIAVVIDPLSRSGEGWGEETIKANGRLMIRNGDSPSGSVCADNSPRDGRRNGVGVSASCRLSALGVSVSHLCGARGIVEHQSPITAVVRQLARQHRDCIRPIRADESGGQAVAAAVHQNDAAGIGAEGLAADIGPAAFQCLVVAFKQGRWHPSATRCPSRESGDRQLNRALRHRGLRWCAVPDNAPATERPVGSTHRAPRQVLHLAAPAGRRRRTAG